MKIIRRIAVCLLLLTGVLHLVLVIATPSDRNALGTLVFGLLYSALGVLLFLKVKYSTIMGIVFPVIGLGSGFIVIGINNWTPVLTFLFAVDVAVILCCILMFLRRENKT